MNQNQQDCRAASVYRVNRFSVPRQARAEFLEMMSRTHAVLRGQKGFVRAAILEQQSHPDNVDLVALLEFTGEEVVARMAAVIAAWDRQNGIDRQAMAARLGIKAEMASYHLLNNLSPRDGFPR